MTVADPVPATFSKRFPKSNLYSSSKGKFCLKFITSFLFSGNKLGNSFGFCLEMTETNFYFQQRVGRLRLNQLSSIDLHQVVRDVDIDLLQKYVENLTFCNLKEDDIKVCV